LREYGVKFEFDGMKLRLKAKRGTFTPRLLREIEARKVEIFSQLQALNDKRGVKAVEAAENYIVEKSAEAVLDEPHKKLYPFLGKEVITPKGRGTLWQVFSWKVGVVLDADPDKVFFFKPEEVAIPEGEK
jgi:hypothetical protein